MQKIQLGISLLLFMVLAASCTKEPETIDENSMTECNLDLVNEYVIDYSIGQTCDSELCENYLNIWEEIFIEKNNLSQAFFDEHIFIKSYYLNDWNSGTSFRVCYGVQIDWGVAYTCDGFIINLDPSTEGRFPALDVPRAVYLNKEQVATVVAGTAFSSDINNLINAESLAYNDFDSALEDLIASSGVDNLCFNTIELNKSGSLIMKALGQYKLKHNSCIEGTVDLITGEKEYREDPCFIP